MTGANYPVGLWKYGEFDQSKIGLKNELPKQIDKYCGMFKTLGDRRL